MAHDHGCPVFALSALTLENEPTAQAGSLEEFLYAVQDAIRCRPCTGAGERSPWVATQHAPQRFLTMRRDKQTRKPRRIKYARRRRC